MTGVFVPRIFGTSEPGRGYWGAGVGVGSVAVTCLPVT
jgi:hypothetical protein